MSTSATSRLSAKPSTSRTCSTTSAVNTRPALNVNGNCAIIVARCIEEAKKKTADEIMSVLQAGNVPCNRAARHRRQVQRAGAASTSACPTATSARAPTSGKHYYQPQIPIYMESVGVQNYFAQSKSIGADNDEAVRGIQQSKQITAGRPASWSRTAPLCKSAISSPSRGQKNGSVVDSE
ncbi:MAG: hypothetical protein ACLR1P_10050 [Oscillospiraceae bacterium]